MKKTMFALCMLLILGFAATASAAPTTYAFTFHDTAGNPYCDGLIVQLYGTPKAVVGGYHFNYNCAGSYSSVGGFKHGLPAVYQYAATGATLDISDPAFALGGSNRSEQYLVNTTYHTWILWSGSDFATNSVVNYGTWVNGVKADVKSAKPSSQR